MRTMKWSSTTRMRMGFEFGIGNSLTFGANFYCDVCSASGCAVDLQARADGFGAFPHVEQSKVPGGVRLIWTETPAVVGHSQNYFVRVVLQFDRDAVAFFKHGSVLQLFADDGHLLAQLSAEQHHTD